MTHYEVLGVAADATPQEIREAFVEKARRHHPDVNAHGTAAEHRRAELEMQRVNAAWAVLGDRNRRKDYDRTLLARPHQAEADRHDAQRRDSLRKTASGASVHFRPIGGERDTFDPDQLDDTPFPNSKPPPRWMQLLPVVLVLAGLGTTILGGMIQLRPVLGLGIVLLALGAVAFLLAPFYVMAQNTGR